MSNAKMKAAELAAKVVGVNQRQNEDVYLTVRRTGKVTQRRNNSTGEIYNLYDYEVFGGSDLSIAQYKADMDAHNWNPIDEWSKKLIFKTKSILPQSEDEKIPLRLVRTDRGFWQLDERIAIMIRDMIRSGYFTESQIEKEVDRIFKINEENELGEIGE